MGFLSALILLIFQIDDKKVNATLKKLGVSAIPGIEEANMFRDTGDVIHFVNPKGNLFLLLFENSYILLIVQASIQSNTFVISGASEVKQIHELFPGIINQLGPDGVNSLRQLAQSYAATTGATGAGAADEDEDIPDLVEGNFEEVSKK